jgi:hypothetical protein
MIMADTIHFFLYIFLFLYFILYHNFFFKGEFFQKGFFSKGNFFKIYRYAHVLFLNSELLSRFGVF